MILPVLYFFGHRITSRLGVLELLDPVALDALELHGQDLRGRPFAFGL